MINLRLNSGKKTGKIRWGKKNIRGIYPKGKNKKRRKLMEKPKELEYHGATVGKKQSRLYQVWSQIKARCFKKDHPKYHNYGGRGITLDSGWRNSFAAFQADLQSEIGERPTKKHTLGRIDNDKGYVPGNLEWQLPTVQNRNTRKNHLVFFQGAMRSLAEVSEMTGVDHRRLQHRVVDQKMSIDDAVKLPLEPGLEFYVYKEKTHKLSAWATILSKPYSVLYDRIHRLKWSTEKAFETPYERHGKGKKL
jgi:hypothetical protein